MTPTNEAGHGLPELPATFRDDFKGDDSRLIESAKALISLSDSGSLAPHGIGGHARTILSAFIVRTESALALSRRVPADMVLVPRVPTDAMALAALKLSLSGDKSINGVSVWHAMIAAAPAAAGAQGEEYAACCDTPAYCSSVRRCTRMDTTPQPAAADGGVRERARVFLAEVLDGYDCPIEPENINIDGTIRTDIVLAALDKALAQQAALSSHRQAGDSFDWVIEITGNPAYPVRITEPAGVNAWEPHASSLGAKFILAVKKLLAAPPPGADLSALHSRFLSDTSGLPEEWQDWRNDFARDIRDLVEKGAGNGR